MDTFVYYLLAALGVMVGFSIGTMAVVVAYAILGALIIRR